MLLVPENLCDVLQAALENKYRTLPCPDPAAGKTVLDQAPDALILDLSLPGTDGLTFLRERKDSLPSVIIALTAFISETLLSDLEQIGVSAVLRIPFRFAHLEEQLTRLIKKSPSRESGRGE